MKKSPLLLLRQLTRYVLQKGERGHGETSQREAMELFDKIPFPEPRRVMNIVERHSPLDIPAPVGGVHYSRG